MKKRVLSIALALVLLLSMSTNCFALSTYTVPDGTVVLETVPTDYEMLIIPDSVQVIEDGQPAYNSMLRYVSLGKGVQYIGSLSFAQTSIETVTIPASVTYIGYDAFTSVKTATFEAEAAINLFNYEENQPVDFTLRTAFPQAKTVHIKTTPDNIELGMLTESPMLEKVYFSDGTVWERGAIYFPTGIKEIPANFFNGIMDRVEIPDSVRFLESYAFDGARFGEFVLGNNVESIGDNLFGSNYHHNPEEEMFDSVTIPASVFYIGANAFPSVCEVTFEAGSAIQLFNRDEFGNSMFDFNSAFPNAMVVNIKTTPDRVDLDLIHGGDLMYIFFADGTVLEKDTPYFPEGIKDIYQNYYSGYTETMKIPDSVKRILPNAFEGARIGHFVLGNNVVEIGDNLFGSSVQPSEDMFSSVTIPSSVEIIGANAFPSVKTVTFEVGSAVNLFGESDGRRVLENAFPNAEIVYIKTTPDKVALDSILGGNIQRVYFSDGSMWDRETPFFTQTISVIPSHFFGGGIGTLTIPDTVTFIESYAFDGAHIENLVLGNNVKSIGENLFGENYSFYDSDFKTITIPSSVTEIGSNAFPGVETVTFEAGSAVALFDREAYIGEGSFSLGSAFPNVRTVHIKTTPNLVNLECLTNGNVETIVFADGSVWKRGELFFWNGQSEILEAQYNNYVDIDEINIPDYIVTIGNRAFENVTCYEEKIPLKLGNNVSYIGSNAFYNSSVGSVVFGASPIVIEENAFANTKITTLNLPANIISLGYNAFATESLKAVTIDASLLTGALENKKFVDVFGFSVDTVVIKGNITEIPATFFEGSRVSSISCSKNIVVINKHAFSNTSIKEANIGYDVIRIGESAFSNTQITSLNIPENVECIGEFAFAYNNNLENAVINANISTLPESMFENCSALKNVRLPDSLSEIGAGAFLYCSALEKIDIPDGVKTIGAYAFENCASLKEVVIPEGVTIIKAGTFRNCTSLKTVVIPESVTVIEDGAFEGCENLDAIVLPENVVQIQNAAFMNCANLSSVVIPESVETVGDNAFAGCDNIILGGCENTAVAAYAEENGIEFCCVNATPCNGTTFDFQNQIVYTTQSLKNDPGSLISPATDTEIECDDAYCGTGSTITITRDGVVQEYTVVVDGDITGDSVCDVLDATMVQRFSSGYGEAPTDLELYAAGGKTTEEITVENYSDIVNKVLSE